MSSSIFGLCGEETLKIIIGETRDYLDVVESHEKCKYVVLLLRGGLKGENGEGFHFVAVSVLTNSGLKIGF